MLMNLISKVVAKYSGSDHACVLNQGVKVKLNIDLFVKLSEVPEPASMT
jgi:hypothetical protein